MEEVIRIEPDEFGKQPTCPGRHLLQACWPALQGFHWTPRPRMWVWGESTTWHEQLLTFKQANSTSNRLPDGGFRALCRWSSYYRYSFPGTPRSGYLIKIVNVIYANLSVTMMAKRPGTEPSLLSIHFFTSSMTLIWIVVCASLEY